MASLQYFYQKQLRWILGIFIYIERGTPLLLQLMFIYFGLPYLGLTFSREGAIYIAFILNYTAYFVEILRGGIGAIDDGQYEASKLLGFSQVTTYLKIILPQALHNCMPSLTNEVLALVKDTSLITILGASELLKAGRNAVNVYASSIPFIYVGIIYLVLTAITTYVMAKIERYYAYE